MRRRSSQHQLGSMAEQKLSVSGDRQKRWNSLLLLTVAFFGVGYLWQVNALATKGFEMKQLEKQIGAEKKEYERHALEAIEQQSLEKIEKKMDILHLVRASRVEYLESTHAMAALR